MARTRFSSPIYYPITTRYGTNQQTHHRMVSDAQKNERQRLNDARKAVVAARRIVEMAPNAPAVAHLNAAAQNVALAQAFPQYAEEAADAAFHHADAAVQHALRPQTAARINAGIRRRRATETRGRKQTRPTRAAF